MLKVGKALLPHVLFDDACTVIMSMISSINAATRDQTGPRLLAFFRFVSPFAWSRHFVVSATFATMPVQVDTMLSVFHPVLSAIFRATSTALRLDFTAPGLSPIDICCGFFSRLIPEIEAVVDVARVVIACAFFPIVVEFLSEFDTLKRYPMAQQAIMPFILTMLNLVPQATLSQAFHHATYSVRKGYLSSLRAMVKLVIETKRPCYFDQVTQRIFYFMFQVTTELGSVMTELVGLLEDILCPMQNPENFVLIGAFVGQVMNDHPCSSEMVTLFVNRSAAKLQSCRALAASLLSRQFWLDHTANGNIVLSSVAFLGSLTTALEAVKDASGLQNFRDLVDRLCELCPLYQSPELITLLQDRMGAAQKLIEFVQRRLAGTMAVEDEAQARMRIADEYKGYPTVRLEWLKSARDVNKERGDPVGELVSQLHVIALTATVWDARRQGMDYPRDTLEKDPAPHLAIVRPMEAAYPPGRAPHSQSFTDWGFMPDLTAETLLDFDAMPKVALILLEGVTDERLRTELALGIQLSAAVGDWYTARALQSFKLRMLHIARDYKQASEVMRELANSFTKLRTKGLTHQSPYSFYYVEWRRQGEERVRRVYCVLTEDVQKFIADVCGSRFQQARAQLCKSHSGQCGSEGVCVVPVVPADDKPVDGEHPHSWREFMTRVELQGEQAQRVVVGRYKTKNYLPHYRMCSDVLEETYKPLAVVDYVLQTADQAAVALDTITKEFDLWFRSQDNISIAVVNAGQLFGCEMGRFEAALAEVFDGRESLRERLRLIPHESAVAGVKKVREPLERLMKVYRRGVDETKETIKSGVEKIARWNDTVQAWLREYGLEPISPGMLESAQNPMSLSFDWEETLRPWGDFDA